MKASDKQKAKVLLVVLIIMMAIRVTSYFTLFPSSIGLTRVVKIGLRLVMTGISAALLLMLATKLPYHKFKSVFRLPLILYVFYLLLGLLSFLWSTGIGFSSLQWIMTTESLVFVILYSCVLMAAQTLYPDAIEFSHILGVAIGIISVAFLVGLFLDPGLFYRQTHGGTVSRLGGFIINPNELGMLAVLGGAMVYYEMLKGRNLIWNCLILVICVVTLLLTQSRSSLGSFALTTGLFVYLSPSKKLKLASIIGGVLAIPVIVQTIIVKAGDIEEVMSMTGRLPFWKDLITDGFPKEPILGYGFMRISYSDYFHSIHAYAAKMTHNTFVQVLINLGLVGAFICILQMATLFYAISATEKKGLGLLAVGMLIPLIINSITEFGIFGESNYGILFYQFIILFFAFSVEKKEVSLNKIIL